MPRGTHNDRMANPDGFFQSDQVDGRELRHALLFRLLGYLRPYWAGLLALLLLMVASAFLEVLPSEFTLRLIDHHLAKGSMAGSGGLVLASWVSCSWASWCRRRATGCSPGWASGPCWTCGCSSSPT